MKNNINSKEKIKKDFENKIKESKEKIEQYKTIKEPYDIYQSRASSSNKYEDIANEYGLPLQFDKGNTVAGDDTKKKAIKAIYRLYKSIAKLDMEWKQKIGEQKKEMEKMQKEKQEEKTILERQDLDIDSEEKTIFKGDPVGTEDDTEFMTNEDATKIGVDERSSDDTIVNPDEERNIGPELMGKTTMKKQNLEITQRNVDAHIKRKEDLVNDIAKNYNSILKDIIHSYNQDKDQDVSHLVGVIKDALEGESYQKFKGLGKEEEFVNEDIVTAIETKYCNASVNTG